MLDVKTSARFGSMWACCRLTEDLRIPILQGLSAENERHDPPDALACHQQVFAITSSAMGSPSAFSRSR